MTDFIRYEEHLPDPSALRDPLLIAAFGGSWGSSAADALRKLVDHWEAEPLASIDPQLFFDFTVRRPRVRVADDDDAEPGVRTIDWPGNEFYLARPEGADRDLVLLVGAEPQLRWRQFIDAIVEVMERVGVSESLMLGAYRAATPHSRPLPVQLYSRDAKLAARFGLVPEPWSYEGPAGITTPLAVACEERGWGSSQPAHRRPVLRVGGAAPVRRPRADQVPRRWPRRQGRPVPLRRPDRGTLQRGRGRTRALGRVRALHRDPRAELRRAAPRPRCDRHGGGARGAGNWSSPSSPSCASCATRRTTASRRAKRPPAPRRRLREPQARPDGVRWCWNWLTPRVGSPETSLMINWQMGRPG